MPSNNKKYPTEKELREQGYSTAEIEAIMDAYDKKRIEEENNAKSTADAPFKKGGSVKSKPKSSASKRADGIAKKGKTRGKMV